MGMKRKFVGRTIPKRPAAAKLPARKEGAEVEGLGGPLMPVESVATEGEGATVALSADEVFALKDAGEVAAGEGAVALSDADVEALEESDEAATQCLPKVDAFDELELELDPSSEGATICGDLPPVESLDEPAPASAPAAVGAEAAVDAEVAPESAPAPEAVEPEEAAPVEEEVEPEPEPEEDASEAATMFLTRAQEFDDAPAPPTAADAPAPEKPAEVPAAQLFVPKLPNKLGGLHRLPLKPLSLPKSSAARNGSTLSGADQADSRQTPTGRRQTLDEMEAYWLSPSKAPAKAALPANTNESGERAAPAPSSGGTRDFGSEAAGTPPLDEGKK